MNRGIFTLDATQGVLQNLLDLCSDASCLGPWSWLWIYCLAQPASAEVWSAKDLQLALEGAWQPGTLASAVQELGRKPACQMLTVSSIAGRADLLFGLCL